MKRLLTLLITIMMLLSMFTACDGGGSGVSSNSGGVKPVGEDGIPDLTGKTITILTQDTWVSGLSLSSILPRFKQIEERTGCKIVWNTASGTDFNTVLQTQLTGNFDECPDIIMLSTSNSAMAKYIDGGLLYDVTKAYDYCPNIKKFYEEYRTDLKTAFTYHDGGIYNLVANVWRDPNAQTQWVSEYGDNALFYRADIAEELGYDSYPTTMDELHQLLLDVKAAYPDMVPMHMWSWGSWQSPTIFNSAYGLHFNNEQSSNYFYPDENGKIVFEPALDATKEWLKEMNQWYKEGLIVIGASEEAKIGSVAQGKTFSGFYSDVVIMCQGQLNTIDPNAYFMYMPFPSKEGYETTVMPRNEYSYYFAVVDNGDEERCISALQFLDYAYLSDYGVYSEQGGVEGEGWSFAEDGSFVPNMDYIKMLQTTDTVLQESGANIHYNGPSTYELEVRQAWAAAEKQAREELGLEQVLSQKQEENWKAINAINVSNYCAAVPSVYYSEEDLEEYNVLAADLGTFVSEKLSQYMLGTADLNNFQTEFVDYLYNKMNLQKVIDIKQKYYDSWLASQK